jgi:uncharacterized protein YdhG (YjbR/CyaY superfamily)
MKKLQLSNTEQVEQYIAKLPKEIQPTIEYLRQFMLSIDENIAEHIKWNSPAFYYSGEMKEFDPKEYKRDILVMNIRKDKIMCVLPTGMNIKNNIEILEGDYTDGRRIINFKNLDDLKQKETRLKEAIKEWLTLEDK